MQRARETGRSFLRPKLTGSGLVQLYEYTGSYVTTLVASDSLVQTASENKQDETFGNALAVGDFNGDGLDDLAVAAVGDDDYRVAVFVYHGSQTGLVLHKKLTESFGAALAVEDFNGDGRDDLAIGAPGWELPRPGKVSVFNGSSTGLPCPDPARGLSRHCQQLRASDLGSWLWSGGFWSRVLDRGAPERPPWSLRR